MLDSFPVRRTVIDRLEKQVRQPLGTYKPVTCSPEAEADYPYYLELVPRDQVVFFQFYLTKGLFYDGDVVIDDFPLFWLMQNIEVENYIDMEVDGLASAKWLFEVEPNLVGMRFRYLLVRDFEDDKLIGRYDNINRREFRDLLEVIRK
jgi:hypothetical protein